MLHALLEHRKWTRGAPGLGPCRSLGFEASNAPHANRWRPRSRCFVFVDRKPRVRFLFVFRALPIRNSSLTYVAQSDRRALFYRIATSSTRCAVAASLFFLAKSKFAAHNSCGRMQWRHDRGGKLHRLGCSWFLTRRIFCATPPLAPPRPLGR